MSPLAAAVDGEQTDALVGPRGDDDDVGGVTVEHEHLRPVQRELAARTGCLHGDPGFVPLARRLGERQRGLRLATGDAGQVRLLGRVVAALQQRVGGQHDRREERCAQQGAAHLLEHDSELDVAVARAAVLLGDVQTLQAHLLAHLRPHRRIEAVLGLHLLAHGGLGALGLEECSDGLAQLFLFFGEGKVHVASVADRRGGAPSVLCTLLYT